MNEKQILQDLHDVGKAYAEGRFLLLCMQQLYTPETEPDFHDQSTLGRTIRTVRFGGASATLSRKTNGTYDLVLLMPGMSPLCVGREHAWECARDMLSVLAHDYDGAVAAVQGRYSELTDAGGKAGKDSKDPPDRWCVVRTARRLLCLVRANWDRLADGVELDPGVSKVAGCRIEGLKAGQDGVVVTVMKIGWRHVCRVVLPGGDKLEADFAGRDWTEDEVLWLLVGKLAEPDMADAADSILGV